MPRRRSTRSVVYQREAAARHRGTGLIADQALGNSDLAVAIGQPPRGNLGSSDRLFEDDDRLHQPDGVGQVERLAHLAALESPQQSANERAGRGAAY